MTFRYYYNKDTEKTVIETEGPEKFPAFTHKFETKELECRATCHSRYSEQHPKMYMIGICSSITIKGIRTIIE